MNKTLTAAEKVGWLTMVIIGSYLLLWMLVPLLTTAKVRDKFVDQAFTECRVRGNVPLFPLIRFSQGRPMEFCEKWAKEHP